MGKWSVRLMGLAAEIPAPPPEVVTDKTDTTHVLSVLAVPLEGGTPEFAEGASSTDRTCADCVNRLRWGTCGKPEAAGQVADGAGFGIAWAEPGHAVGCSAFEARHLDVASPPRPYRLAPRVADVAHREPWSGAEITRFALRVARLRRRGFVVENAEDLAEGLHLRDLHADHRQTCLECRHLAGTTATGWRCGNHAAAGVARELPTALVVLFQVCPGVEEAKP